MSGGLCSLFIQKNKNVMFRRMMYSSEIDRLKDIMMSDL